MLTANDKSTPKNTSVLYAQWKINGASLKFNPNGGIGHVDDVTGDAFSTVTIPGDAKEPKITRPGYRFVGWSTEKNPPAGSTFLQPGEGKVTLPRRRQHHRVRPVGAEPDHPAVHGRTGPGADHLAVRRIRAHADRARRDDADATHAHGRNQAHR